MTDWARVIRHSSPADLGWSAGSPAPEEALEAIAEARDTGLRSAAAPPFIERHGRSAHPEGRGYVAALLVDDPAGVGVSVDPRTPGAGADGPVRLLLAYRKGRWLRRVHDALMADLAAALREQQQGGSDD